MTKVGLSAVKLTLITMRSPSNISMPLYRADALARSAQETVKYGILRSTEINHPAAEFVSARTASVSSRP